MPCWLGFAVTQIPLLLYMRIASGRALAPLRRDDVRHRRHALWEIAWRGAVNYLQDFQLWHYVVSGDVKPYAHTPGTSALLAVSVALSVAGIVLILLRLRDDPFWRYALAALLVSPIPAATTIDRHHALRLAPLAVMLVVVAIPAIDALGRCVRPLAGREWSRSVSSARRRPVRRLRERVRHRRAASNRSLRGGCPGLLAQAWANGGTAYVDYDDREPQALARWYALTEGIDQSRVVRLLDGGIPPVGAIAFGRTQECDYVCERIAESGDYWIARVVGPRARSASRAARRSTASRRGRSSARGSPRTSGSCRSDAFLPGHAGLPAGLGRQLLVTDAQRHHLARPRPVPRRARDDLPARGPEALRLADAEDEVDPVAHRDVLALAVDVDVARACRARRPSDGRGRRPCRSRSRAAGRAHRARSSRASSACVMIVPVT